MAKEKELNVEERLKALYELQTILSEVDRIKTLRGELPLEVQDLEDEIEGLQTRISKYDEEIAALNATIKEQSEAADKADAMVAKYTKDQDNVRNNREYDFLTKEIEYQQLNIELAEKKINDAKHAIDVTNANMDAAKTQLEDCTHVLAEKKGELDEIISETKQDEEKLAAEKALEEMLAKVQIGVTVTHKKFGSGAIVWIDSAKKYLRVKFDAGEKQFVFPDAFLMKFLEVK